MKQIKGLINKLLVFLFVLSPVSLMAQIGNPGDIDAPGNPDARPQDVPFDGRLSWFLIAAGLILAVVVLRKYINRKQVA